MLARELKVELEARDQPKTGNKRHGCAPAPERLHAARSSSWFVRARRGRISCRAIEWTLLPFCDMDQTFTILIVV